MPNNISLNVFIVVIIVFIGKIISFLRNLSISYYFGATKTSDAYFAAFSTPSIIFSAFISSYLVLLIPQYDKIRTNKGLTSANSFLSRYLTFVTISSILLSTLFYISMDGIISNIAPDLDLETKNLAISLGAILVISFPFTAISLSLAAISSAHSKFYAQHIIPIFSGILVIFSLFLFVEKYGIYVLAVAGVFANVIQVVIQLIISKSYFTYDYQFKILDIHLKKMSILVFPVFISYSVEQFNQLINTIISSGLKVGSLSALNYAQTVQLTILGTITTAVLTVLYPKMSKLSSEQKNETMLFVTWNGIKYLILILTPVIIYISINVNNLVELIFLRGSFNIEAANSTSSILFYFVINIFFLSMREFIIRFYYLSERTRIPMYVGVFTVLLNIVFSYSLVGTYGVSGLSLANLIATSLGVLLLALILLMKKELSSIIMDIKSFFLKLAFSVVSVIILHQIFGGYINNNSIVSFAIYFIIYTTIFYLLLLLTKQQETANTLLLLINRLKLYVFK